MLNESEQLILLLILKKGKINKKTQTIINSDNFYTFIKKLEKEELIYSNYNNKIKYWYLTDIGTALAKILTKLKITPKEFQDNRVLVFVVDYSKIL